MSCTFGTQRSQMHVRVVETWAYHSDGRRRAPEKVTAPTWEQIEAAIRRLDGLERPILFLWASDDPALQMVDEFSERLEVLGGAGVWWLAGTFGGYFQRRLLDPVRGPEEVELYPRQVELGFGAPARHVTRDIGQVLLAARHYAEHGGFEPALPWE
ncbi:hypothetical protein R5W24_004974 [Gemmata sp. JC717]|uniref:hypothetical protein n=1 Tax=Gemmata algarum TaxID=2975278 RepID=UPI0021BB4382|nr:hypothetical protein [Gemmata algarum]MDY3555828.1 hypothetical protein [Gemmata algarum]